MKTISRLILLVFSLVLALLPVACQGNNLPRQTVDPIRVGLILPLTGEFADSTGQDGLNGAQLAVRQINEAGGVEIKGKQRLVELVVEDDQDRPDVALSAVRKLAFQEQVVAIVGVPLSRIAIPVAEFAETIPLPLISSWSTHPKTTEGKRYIFRATVTDRFQGRAIAQFAYTQLQARTAAILYDVASEYNKGLAEFFKAEFQALGGQVVASETYTTDTNQDFTEQLKTIRQSNPAVLFLPNYSVDLAQQAPQIQALELSAALIGGDTWGSLSPITQQQLEGGFYSLDWTPQPRTEQGRQFFQAYEEKYQKPPKVHAALAYDAMGLLFAALSDQKQTDPEAIRQGLSQLEYEGVTGRMLFQGSGDPIKELTIFKLESGQPQIFQTIQPHVNRAHQNKTRTPIAMPSAFFKRS
ncbi:ABC transporter substrate-binding protein [Spirulina subsalsa]|uniref:ABC transporter substrate-binding protein n=1 Tax=Spirulina subsalsa TaxID=54311 RepID=UPI00031D587A|nr:ABC transporter substrate-binding protein [Spirulina subsalsa]